MQALKEFTHHYIVKCEQCDKTADHIDTTDFDLGDAVPYKTCSNCMARHSKIIDEIPQQNIYDVGCHECGTTRKIVVANVQALELSCNNCGSTKVSTIEGELVEVYD